MNLKLTNLLKKLLLLSLVAATGVSGVQAMGRGAGRGKGHMVPFRAPEGVRVVMTRTGAGTDQPSAVVYAGHSAPAAAQASVHRAAAISPVDVRGGSASVPVGPRAGDSGVINVMGKNNWTTLHWAAYAGNVDAVEKLLKSGAGANAPDRHDLRPLHLAAYFGHDNVVALLVAVPGIDVNAKDNLGVTPLQLAIAENKFAAASVLVFAGADLDALSEEENVALQALSIEDQKAKEELARAKAAFRPVAGAGPADDGAGAAGAAAK